MGSRFVLSAKRFERLSIIVDELVSFAMICKFERYGVDVLYALLPYSGNIHFTEL